MWAEFGGLGGSGNDGGISGQNLEAWRGLGHDGGKSWRPGESRELGTQEPFTPFTGYLFNKLPRGWWGRLRETIWEAVGNNLRRIWRPREALGMMGAYLDRTGRPAEVLGMMGKGPKQTKTRWQVQYTTQNHRLFLVRQKWPHQHFAVVPAKNLFTLLAGLL